MRLLISTLVTAAALACNSSLAQGPDALRVYSSNGVRAVLQEMRPQIEEAVGRELSFEFSTSRDLTDRIVADEAFDVAVVTPSLLDELDAQRKLVPESRSEFARVGVGVGSREGTPAKSVDTIDDLRGTLLEAESIAYGASGQSRRTNEASFEYLGIADEVRSKTRLTGPGEGPRLVAAGEIELVLTLVSELLREPGVQYLGPFPREVQGYVQFAAAASSESHDPVAARAFIRFLSTPAFIEALEEHGLERTRP